MNVLGRDRGEVPIEQHQALQRGVYLRPLGNVVYLLPPLCISDSQLERCYAAIASGLADVNRT